MDIARGASLSPSQGHHGHLRLMDIMKKAAVDVDMHIALWTERPRLGPATWQQAELYWLTPAPLVTIKPCHHQALCPLLVLMSENFSQVKEQPDFSFDPALSCLTGPDSSAVCVRMCWGVSPQGPGPSGGLGALRGVGWQVLCSH